MIQGNDQPSHQGRANITCGAEARRAEVAEMYCRCYTQVQLAERFGVALSTIENDLRIIRRRWIERQERGFEEAVATQLEKLDRLEREAWDAWDRSRQPKTKTVMRQGDAGSKTGTKAITERDGNPRYLEQIQKCLAQRAKLLGLNAPTKIAPTDPTGNLAYGAAIMHQLVEMDLSNDELDALRKLRGRLEQADQPRAIEVAGAVVDDVDPAVDAPVASGQSNAS
jgi:hypothetical protein